MRPSYNKLATFAPGVAREFYLIESELYCFIVLKNLRKISSSLIERLPAYLISTRRCPKVLLVFIST